MTLSDFASIGSLVSGAAVLASLIYLSLQLRQNSKHSRALIQQGRAERTVELQLRLAEFDDSDGMDACFAGAPDISARDLRRFLYRARAIHLNIEDSFLQHREGLLVGLGFEGFEGTVRGYMATPGHRVAWKVLRSGVSTEFRDYMDRVFAESSAESMDNLSTRWKAAAVELSSATSQ